MWGRPMEQYAIKVRFDRDLYERLRARSDETGAPMAELVRRAVRDALGPAPSDADKRQARRLALIDRAQK